MIAFLKRLLCWHYWDNGTPVDPDPAYRLTIREFHCIKCQKKKVKPWNWGISQNIMKHNI